MLMELSDLSDKGTVPLSAVLSRVGAKAKYTYDFGDDWEHSIVLEKRLPADPNLTYPCARAVAALVRRRTVGAYMGITILWKLSVTPTTSGTRKCWIGLVSMIRKPFRWTR